MSLMAALIVATTLAWVSSADASWQWQSPKPQGEQIRRTQFFDSNNGVAVGRAGTFLKTTDGGNTWYQRSIVAFRDLWDLSFPNPETGYVVGDSGLLLKTTDGGVTWLSQTTWTSRVLRAVTFPFGTTVGYATGNYGTLLKTTNGGALWQLQTSGTTSDLEDVFFPTPDTGFVTLYNALLRTTDGGATWALAVAPWYGVSRIDFPSGADTGYVIGQNNGGATGRVHKTVDAGLTWTIVLSGSYERGSDVCFPNGPDTGYVGWDDYLYTPWWGVRKTVDGGSNWSQSFVEPNDRVIRALAFGANSLTGYAMGDIGVIWKTQDGGASWAPKHESLTSLELWSVDVSSSDHNRGVVVGAYATALRTTNGGQSWVKQNTGVGNQLWGVDYSQGDTVFAVGEGGCILRSPDGGATWFRPTSGTTAALYEVRFPSDATTGYVVGNGGTIRKTTDGGTNWFAQSSGTGNRLIFICFLADPNTAIAVGAGGTIVRTTDGGTSWALRPSGTGNELWGVHFPAGGSTGYAVGAGGTILKSMDGGLSWGTQSSGVTVRLDQVCFPASASVGYVVGDGGTLLKTTDGGTTWNRLNPGTWNVFRAICFPGGNDTGYVVGQNGTILKTTNGGGLSSSSPAIAVSPGSLNVTLPFGGTAARTVLVGNVGNGTLAWQVSENPAVGWLAASPDSGRVLSGTQMAVEVQFDAAGLDSGSYGTILRIASNDPGTPQVDVPVSVLVASDSIPRIVVDTAYPLLPGQPLTIEGWLRNYDGLPYIPPAWTFGVDDPVRGVSVSLFADSLGRFGYTVTVPDTARLHAFRFFLSYEGQVLEQWVVVPLTTADTFFMLQTDYVIDLGSRESLPARTSLFAKVLHLLRPPELPELIHAGKSSVTAVASATWRAWNRYAQGNPGLKLVWPATVALGASRVPPDWMMHSTALLSLGVCRDFEGLAVMAFADMLDDFVDLAPGLEDRQKYHDAINLGTSAYTGISAIQGRGLCELFAAVAELTDQDGWDIDTIVVHDVVCRGDEVVSFMMTVYGGDGVVLSAAIGPRPEPPLAPGWTEPPAMPLVPSGKMAKDGAWLAFDGSAKGSGTLYVAKGNKTGDVYGYSLANGGWTTLALWPMGTENKPPYKGAAGVSDGSGRIYATKGNNTAGFWCYDAGANTWTQLADVPLGLSNKRVKGGTDLAYVDDGESTWVYLLKGYKTEFYRYNTVSGAWYSLADAPSGSLPKWDKGSWLVYDASGNRLLAHKAKNHELYAYDLATQTWGPTLPGMPLLNNQTGKSKKSKDGGSAAELDGVLYALKGGNTQDFYALDLGAMAWSELETIPAYGSTGKKKRVKAGGDVATDGVHLYVLKGNKTAEFWRYVPGAAGESPNPNAQSPRDGVQEHRSLQTGDCKLQIVRNPSRGSATVRWSGLPAAATKLAVYDAVGRCVQTATLTGRSGSTRLGALTAGVYLVRISGGVSLTRKLVIE